MNKLLRYLCSSTIVARYDVKIKLKLSKMLKRRRELEERIKLVELILKMNDTQFAEFKEKARILLNEQATQSDLLSYP